MTFPPLTGSDVRVTVTGVRPVTTIEYHENQPIVMPVGDRGGRHTGRHARRGARHSCPPRAAPTCSTVDGAPVALRFAGTPPTAQRAERSTSSPARIRSSLAAGDHLVRSTPGTSTGIDVDGVVLGSDATGAPGSLGPGGSLGNFTQSVESAPAGKPEVRVVDDGRTKKESGFSGAEPGEPFWLVLGESNSKGWKASVANDDASVVSGPGAGRSTLVDGYANGWLVVPNSPSFDVAGSSGRHNVRCGSHSRSSGAALLGACVALVSRAVPQS